MKAVRIHSFGGPEVLKLEELQTPSLADDQVLIRVQTASVNPVDYKTRAGKYPAVKADQLPRVLGRDVAGKVEQCGAGVRSWQPGDAVYALLDRERGGYAQLVALNADLCARAPKNLSATEAAAIPLAGLTAWQGLFDHGQLREGQSVLIHGGAGGVGHLAIQFAKARGAHVSTTVSTRDIDFARELGADIVIDRSAQRFEELLSDIDLVFDLVAGEVQKRSIQVLTRGGTLVSTLGKPDESALKEREIRGVGYMAEPNAAQLNEITQLIEAGKVRPYVHATFPLAEVARAHEVSEKDHPRGKIVLEVPA
jgi:NADPH:quinone reductase-like Zn-dependent oxidoreductase